MGVERNRKPARSKWKVRGLGGMLYPGEATHAPGEVVSPAVQLIIEQLNRGVTPTAQYVPEVKAPKTKRKSKTK